jgi:signal transduction histidine kinase
MAELGKPGDVARGLIRSIGETLYPSGTTVVFRPHEGAGWQVESASGGEDLDPEKLGLDGPFVRRLVEVGTAVERSQLEVDRRFVDVREEAEAQLGASGIRVVLPLVQGGEIVGIVLLGEKRNLRAYTSEDLEFIEELGAAASIGLANALLFERVDAQRRDLEELAGTLEKRVQERTRELEAANQGLKELDRLKSRFFANISHELRTPLTLILAPLGSMLSGAMGSFNDEQREHLRGIRGSGMELLRLINDLLDLSKLEESRMRLLVERVDLGTLLGKIVSYSAPLAERKKIRVVLKPGTGPVVEADSRKLERVFVNLLTNALKFTEEGGRVTLSVERRGESAVVSVEDTGIGIPQESLERIFDRFHQVDDTTIRTRGGTGIGLALAKELVELHTGTLTVTSSIGQGSTFTVEIPIDADGIPSDRIDRRIEDMPVTLRRREEDLGLPEWNEEVTASPEYRFMGIENATERRLVPRTNGSGFKSARLLVVDDNPELLRYVHRVLSEFYDVMPVQDGERAWEVMQKEHPDLVISDVMMPGVSGLELCRLIKKEPATQDTPVILLTARGSTEHRIEGHEVGADEYIPKPFEADELLAAVSGLLLSRVRRSEVAARRHSASLETLLAGMAHELRNASHQVRSAHAVMRKLSSRVLENGGGRDPELVEDLRGRVEKMDAISHRALSRISKVVRGLQQYSIGQASLQWSDVDIDDLVRREVRMLGVEDRSIHVDLALGSAGVVRGSTEELRQMILNLVENAVHAVEEGGTVRVRTERLSGKLRLVVVDDGRGIPADVLDRVFDPFFTTRDPGQGMGLGLALVKRTVTDHGGSIEIASQEGEGTEVVVELPALGVQAAREAEIEA